MRIGIIINSNDVGFKSKILAVQNKVSLGFLFLVAKVPGAHKQAKLKRHIKSGLASSTTFSSGKIMYAELATTHNLYDFLNSNIICAAVFFCTSWGKSTSLNRKNHGMD